VYLKYKVQVRAIWLLAKCIVQDLTKWRLAFPCRKIVHVFHRKLVVKSTEKLSCIKLAC